MAPITSNCKSASRLHGRLTPVRFAISMMMMMMFLMLLASPACLAQEADVRHARAATPLSTSIDDPVLSAVRLMEDENIHRAIVEVYERPVVDHEARFAAIMAEQ